MGHFKLFILLLALIIDMGFCTFYIPNSGSGRYGIIGRHGSGTGTGSSRYGVSSSGIGHDGRHGGHSGSGDGSSRYGSIGTGSGRYGSSSGTGTGSGMYRGTTERYGRTRSGVTGTERITGRGTGPSFFFPQ